MKIIASSNFDNERVSDVVVAENVKVANEGNIMVDALNKATGPSSTYFYKLVEDHYKLYEWKP